MFPSINPSSIPSFGKVSCPLKSSSEKHRHFRIEAEIEIMNEPEFILPFPLNPTLYFARNGCLVPE